MKSINDDQLAGIVGGGDPAVQPLTEPPGWTPHYTPGPPFWIYTVTDYLKSMGIFLAN